MSKPPTAFSASGSFTQIVGGISASFVLLDAELDRRPRHCHADGQAHQPRQDMAEGASDLTKSGSRSIPRMKSAGSPAAIKRP